MTADQIVGERFNTAMFRKRISQTTLANQLGITQAALSRKLHGDRPWSLTEILTVAAYLDMPLEEVFRELPHMDSNHEPCGFWSAPLASDLPVAA